LTGLRLQVLSDAEWGIKFDFVLNKVAGVMVAQKKFEADMARRIWNMSYLDNVSVAIRA
jgi:hypothetical protein